MKSCIKPTSISLPILSTAGAGALPDAKAPGGTTSGRPHSTMGKWRAVVLVLVHAAIAAHIAQWLISGMSDGVRNTISPIEPSEAMYTLEAGQLNAGFIMFCVAIASTLIFGRFFCGWLCHVVALQDFCGYLLKKVGIHPKPWRSRLLVFVPLVLGLYMFIWPTFRRIVLEPLMLSAFGVVPAWMGQTLPLRGFTSHFMVEDFWATFPVWYIAVPFLLVCGFATVYFLGAKAFCTYGCPYGGFFGPVDRLSPFRIKVDDNCNSCGHCTAVCTSNVQVAAEVRDYGAVVDPGCMKCMDCVSACPNDALSVGWTTPAAFMAPRNVESHAKSQARQQARFDLTGREEIIFGLVFFFMFFGYRGLYGAIPLLMAAGFAAIGTFLAFKLWRTARDTNVRGPFVQIKLGGKLRPAGIAFVAAAFGYVLIAAHGVVMHVGQWQGNMIYDRLDVSREVVFAPGYTPRPDIKARAERALAWHKPSRAISEGGVALYTSWGELVRASWLSAVAGDLAGAEANLRQAIGDRAPRIDLAQGLINIMRLRSAPVAELDAQWKSFTDRFADDADLLAAHRDWLLSFGRTAEAVALGQRGVTAAPRDPDMVAAAVVTHLRLGTGDDLASASELVAAGLVERPTSPVLHMSLGQIALVRGKPADAAAEFTKAHIHQPTPERAVRLADALASSGDLPGAVRTIDDALAEFDATPNLIDRMVRAGRAVGGPAASTEALVQRLLEQAARKSTDEATRQAIAQQLLNLDKPAEALGIYQPQLERLRTEATRVDPVIVRNACELMLVVGKPELARNLLADLLAPPTSTRPAGPMYNAPVLYGIYGTTLFAAGDVPAAKLAFSRGRELAANFDPAAKLADQLTRVNRNADAEDLYADAVARTPRHVPTRLNAAGLALTKNLPQVALDNALAGLAVDPTNAALLEYAGRAQFLLGNDQAASELLQQACEREPTSERIGMYIDVLRRIGTAATLAAADAAGVQERALRQLKRR